MKSVNDFEIGLITVPSGVDFDSPNWKTINLIIFIIGPEGKSKEYNKVFSAISHTLNTPGVVEELLGESTSEALRESFFVQCSRQKIMNYLIL